MITKHIFKAYRGEGKTKWLVNKALESEDAGVEPIYVGSMSRYELFCQVYEALAHHSCQIKRLGPDDIISQSFHQCLLTDEFMSDYKALPYISRQIVGDWYITMSAEDFI